MALDLKWILTADDKATPVFGKVLSSGKVAAEGIGSAFEGAVGKLNLVKGAVAALGAYLSIEAVKDVALLAARYETLGMSMNVVGNNAGYTASQMAEFQTKLQDTGIAMIESRESLTKMASANIDLAKSSDLARIAQDAAVIGGINSSDAFARMVQGIQSGEVEVLKTIGINVSFENSYKKLAQTLGKSTTELSELEKMTARTNSVIDKGKDIAGVYEAAMGTAGKQIQSVKRYTDNLKVTIGSVFNDALVVAVEAFTGAVKTGNKEAADLAQKGQLKQWGQDIVIVMAVLADGIGIVFNVLNTLVLTGVAGLQQLYYGATAFMQALNGDFSGAKESFNSILVTGEAWVDLVAKQWKDSTKYQDAARKMFADRENESNKAAAKSKTDTLELARIAAGESSRAIEASKSVALAKEKGLERELESLKANLASENALLKEQSSITSDLLRGQYDAGLVTTAAYYDQVQQIANTAAQKKFEEAAIYLRKEEELLSSVGQNKGESSPEYAKELTRNKQAIEAVQMAQLGYAKVYIDTEVAKAGALKKETEGYEKLNITTLDAAGQFEKAEIARQSMAQKSAEYLRMEASAANGNVAAAKALSDQVRLDAAAAVESRNRADESTRGYAEAALLAKDAVDALNGKDAEAIKGGADLRAGLDKEMKLRRDLAAAWANGTAAAISSISSQILSQDVLNQRLRDEIALRERKGVLTGAIVGYNGDEAIYADGYAKSQTAAGYVSNSQLLGGAGPSVGVNYWGEKIDAGGNVINQFNMPTAYAEGTPYVPRTGLALIHQGERIVTAADNAKGSYGATTVNLGGISIAVQGGSTPAATVDQIVKQLIPRLDGIARRRWA